MPLVMGTSNGLSLSWQCATQGAILCDLQRALTERVLLQAQYCSCTSAYTRGQAVQLSPSAAGSTAERPGTPASGGP